MDQPAPSPSLSRAATVRWLCSDAVVDRTGAVWSWHNPEHPGYPYPEAAGLWLGLMAREPDAGPVGNRVATWLADRARLGTLGRDGRHYTFDRGMVLAGRLAWAERNGESGESLRPEITALCKAIEAGRAVHDDATPSRWSEWFGPHQLKLALPLARAHSLAPSQCERAMESLFEVAGQLPADGRARTNAHDDDTYLHAHCYAAEGLWALSVHLPSASLRARAAAAADRSVAWLAAVQHPDGGIAAWHDGQAARGDVMADATAQAIRLWAGRDPERYRSNISAGVRALARLSAASGGLRYREDSEDHNTWASIFAVQAVDFAAGRGQLDEFV